MTLTETQVTELLEFAKEIARTCKDGDILSADDGTLVEHMAEGNDEEVDALYGFISAARDITGVSPANLVEICECGRNPQDCTFLEDGETHGDT